MFEIRSIDKNHKADINIPNEPFPLCGKMVPSLCDGIWRYRIEPFSAENLSEMTFPDENYDFEEMSSNCYFVGAYEGETCIGLAIWQKQWHRFLYLYDLKVNRDYRRNGVASSLIEYGKGLSAKHGYRGIYTIGQDNNLIACKFYLKNGFEIGGFDNRIYKGTGQEGKGDIYFYWERNT